MNRARNLAARSYERITPRTAYRAIWAVVGLMILLMLLSAASMGFITGASAAIDGEPLETNEVASVEHQIWEDMGQGNAIVRSFYGVFHWLTAMSVWLGVLAMRAGYAVPTAGYVLEWPIRVMPYLFILLIAAQIVRMFEIAFDKDFSSLLRATNRGEAE